MCPNEQTLGPLAGLKDDSALLISPRGDVKFVH